MINDIKTAARLENLENFAPCHKGAIVKEVVVVSGGSFLTVSDVWKLEVQLQRLFLLTDSLLLTVDELQTGEHLFAKA